MLVVHPEELVGHTINVPQENDEVFHIRILEALKDHKGKLKEHPSNKTFQCLMNNDAYEEIFTYQQIMDYLSKDQEHPVMWKFNKIIAHQGPLSKQHRSYKGSSYNVT